MVYYQIFGRATCPFCTKAWELLVQRGINHMFCEMGACPDLISHYKEKYDSTTVPIIIERYTDNDESKYIGGCTDLIKYLEKPNDEESD